MTAYNVLIIGGGPAGSALAYLLASQGKSVLLIEGSDYSKPRVGETLPAHIKPELQKMGLWNDFLNLNPKESYGIQSAWSKNEATFRSHILNPLGNAWHVNRNDFDKMLFLKAKENNVSAYLNARVKKLIQLENKSWNVIWNNENGEHKANADIYIDATGRKSQTKNKDKLTYQSFDQLVGIGSIFESNLSTLKHLIICACEVGWWYLAPLEQNKSVVFLMTDLDIVKRENLTMLRHWIRKMPLNDPLFETLKEELKDDHKLVVKPAQSQIVKSIHAHQFFTVGDALVSFDPLSGTGVVRALQTASGLARWLKHNDNLTPENCSSFLEEINPLYQEYLNQWFYMYDAVSDWKDFPFWEKRHKMDVSL